MREDRSKAGPIGADILQKAGVLLEHDNWRDHKNGHQRERSRGYRSTGKRCPTYEGYYDRNDPSFRGKAVTGTTHAGR